MVSRSDVWLGRARWPALALAIALTTAALVGAQSPPARAAISDAPPIAAPFDLEALIRAALLGDPAIALAALDVDRARGDLQQQRGRFDPLVTSGVAASAGERATSSTSASDVDALSSDLGLDQQLRSGRTLSASMRVDRDGSGRAASNLGTIAFTLGQPLLRGRGRDIAAADEASAEDFLRSARADRRHTVATRLRTAVRAYWSLHAEVRNVDVLRRSEERARTQLASTRILVEADRVPAADLVQLEADVLANEESRIAGEQARTAARLTLGQILGLDATASAALPDPAIGFPASEAATLLDVPDIAALLDLAALRRDDLRAAAERERVAARDVQVARDDLRPSLDLLLTPSYTGAVEGGDVDDLFAGLYRNVPGAQATLSLRLRWDPRNRAAEGALVRSNAAVAPRALERAQLRQAIESAVAIARD
ncbi:MAG: TolC family protein, partial [Acidobacteriota bacterium]